MSGSAPCLGAAESGSQAPNPAPPADADASVLTIAANTVMGRPVALAARPATAGRLAGRGRCPGHSQPLSRSSQGHEGRDGREESTAPSACMGPGHRHHRPPRQIRQPGVRIWPPGHRIWPTWPWIGGLSQRRRRHQERRRGTRGEEDLAAVPCACTDTSRRCSSRGSHLVNLHAGRAGPDRRPAAGAPPTRGGRAPPPPSQPAGRPCRQPAPAAARRARRRGVRGRRRGRGRPSRPAWGSDAGVSGAL